MKYLFLIIFLLSSCSVGGTIEMEDNTMLEDKYFFYSEKQKEIGINFGDTHTNFARIDGEIVEYTQMQDDKEPAGKWDDYIHLGKGDYSHTNNWKIK